MPAIDWILESLVDGKWHHLSEILERSQLPRSRIETIVDFLSEFKLIDFDRGLKKVRLTSQTLSFLKNVREVEKGLKSLHQKDC